MSFKFEFQPVKGISFQVPVKIDDFCFRAQIAYINQLQTSLLVNFFPFAYCRFSVIDLREQIYCITWASCSIIKKSIPLELQAYPSNNNASALVIPLSYSAI